MKSSHDEELVSLPRAIETFRELFEKMIPIEIFYTLRKKVEALVIKEDSQQNMSNIIVDKFLEYSCNVY